MTHEEAIKVLRWALNRLDGHDYITGDYGTVDPSAKVNAFGMAIEALEKQIPKKPLHMHKNYYCPVCRENGWMLWDDAIPNDMDSFCGICGQAIDWSVSK